MALEFVDKSGEPRTDEEIREAIEAIKKDLVEGDLSPLKIHYLVIVDGLTELLSYRELIAKLKEKKKG